MKSFAIILITLTITSQVFCDLEDSNIISGDCDGTGTVIYHEEMNVGWSSLGIDTETRTACCPESDATIKCIEVKDMRNDGTNGAAEISSGGPGQHCATMTFTSQLYRGMDFNITVWTH